MTDQTHDAPVNGPAEPVTYRTITLTGRRPVRFREDQWPQITHGHASDHDGQIYAQSNRRWRVDIRVRAREIAGGRAVVYGVADYESDHQGERGLCAKAGILLDATTDPQCISRAVVEVGDTLRAKVRDAGPGNWDTLSGFIGVAVSDCLADLPAEELE